MAELLLINPRKRRASKAKRRKTVRTRARRRNPISTFAARRPARRRNPSAIARRVMHTNPKRRAMRRRRNPISMGGLNVRSILSSVKDAAIGAGGAVAVDMLYGRIAPMLPASLQRVPGQVGAGDAVKAVLTVAIGKLLNKATRGLSAKAAQGALTVQAHGIISGMLPAGTLGYYSPAMVTQGTNRVGPIRKGVNGVGAYMKAGSTPLLNAYMKPGQSALLSGFVSARDRERSVR